MQPTSNPFQELSAYFGNLFGEFAGLILAILLMVFLLFVLWGLPWERLISKAGFTGRAYWFLLGLFFVPVLLAFPISLGAGAESELAKSLGQMFGLATYLGLWILAICPWGIHRKLRQSKVSTPSQ